MKKTLIALACGLMAGATSADNIQGWYAGGGVSYLDSGVSTDDNRSLGFSALEFMGGYKFKPYLGAELRVGTGFSSENGTVDEQNRDYSLSNYTSVYYRIESVNQIAKLYGLFGFSNISIDVDNNETGTSSSNSDSGASWGIGAGFITGPKTNINFEYRTILSNSDNDFSGMTINYDYRF